MNDYLIEINDKPFWIVDTEENIRHAIAMMKRRNVAYRFSTPSDYRRNGSELTVAKFLWNHLYKMPEAA